MYCWSLGQRLHCSHEPFFYQRGFTSPSIHLVVVTSSCHFFGYYVGFMCRFRLVTIVSRVHVSVATSVSYCILTLDYPLLLGSCIDNSQAHHVFIELRMLLVCHRNINVHGQVAYHFFLLAVILSVTRSSSSKLWLAIVLVFVNILPAYDIRTFESGRPLPRT